MIPLAALQFKCEQQTTQRRNPTFPRPEFPANPYTLPAGDIPSAADGCYSTLNNGCQFPSENTVISSTDEQAETLLSNINAKTCRTRPCDSGCEQYSSIGQPEGRAEAPSASLTPKFSL